MKTRSLLLVVPVLAFVGLGAYLWQGGQHPPAVVIPGAAPAGAEETETQVASLRVDAAGHASEQRQAVESSHKTRSLTLRGRVVDASRAPVAGAEVAMFRRDLSGLRGFAGDAGSQNGRFGRFGRGRGGPGAAPQQRADQRQRMQAQRLPGAVRTAADGTFALSGVVAVSDAVELHVDHQEFVPRVVPHRTRRGAPAAAAATAEPVTATDATVDEIVLARGAAVSGVVLDERGKPVAGAEVSLRMQRGRRGRNGPADTVPGAGAAPTPEGPGAAGRGNGGRDPNGRGTDGPGRGRRGANGGGFGGFGGFGGRGGFGGARGPAAVKTDENGAFRLVRASAGEFVVEARATKHLRGSGEPFRLDEGQSRTDEVVRLRLGAAMTGVVLDQSGAPIAGAQVLAMWDAKGLELPQAATDQGATGKDPEPANGGRGRRGGRGAFGRGGNNGRGNGGRGGPGGQGGGFADALRFLGGRAGMDADGLARMAAMLAQRGGGDAEQVRTDARGQFVLDSLPPGAFRLTVGHEHYIRATRENVIAAATPLLEVRLDGCLQIAGVVVDASTGQPVESFGIQARRVRGAPRTPEIAGAENRPPQQPQPQQQQQRTRGGEVSPEAQARIEARRAEREKARQDRTRYLAERLGPTGRVPGPTPPATAHAQGRFALADLTPGTYAIDIQAP
ncbi:MAG: carboxypeptidase regulatory-like domain-containing protein, partial [Planctomycetes bacterium]|nr:carboxypeptidase regulatory-like domain-containing protein [Planctomycetota bacterium]